MTLHEYDQVFTSDSHTLLYNVSKLDCIYRCLLLGYEVKMATYEETSRGCSCTRRYVNIVELGGGSGGCYVEYKSLLIVDLQRKGMITPMCM